MHVLVLLSVLCVSDEALLLASCMVCNVQWSSYSLAGLLQLWCSCVLMAISRRAAVQLDSCTIACHVFSH